MANPFKIIMLEAYNELVSGLKGGLFFQNLFSTEVVSNTEKIELDVQRSIRIVATDVARGAGVGNQNVTGVYTNKEFRPPLYWEETPVSAAQLKKRIPGMTPYESVSDMEALAYWVAEAQAFNARKILNAIELMAAQALQTGIITLNNGENVDFGKKGNHNLVPSVKWDQVTADPEADFRTMCQRIQQNGKRKPTVAIFGANAWRLWSARLSAKYNNSADFIRPGFLEQGPVMEGATFQGRWSVGGFLLDLFLYDDFYETPGATINDATTKVDYMDTNRVIIMNPQARLTKAFAATEILPQWESEYIAQGLPAVPEFSLAAFTPFAYPKPPSVWMAGVQSAPLVIPTEIDSIGTISAVNT